MPDDIVTHEIEVTVEKAFHQINEANGYEPVSVQAAGAVALHGEQVEIEQLTKQEIHARSIAHTISSMRPEWQKHANCRGLGPERFYTKGGNDSNEANKVCDGCPVLEDCLKHALSYPEEFGIWAGTSERQRRRIRVSRTKAS